MLISLMVAMLVDVTNYEKCFGVGTLVYELYELTEEEIRIVEGIHER